MRLSLKPHPDFPTATVSGLDVDVARDRAAPSAPQALLILRYVVTLAQDKLLLPPAAAPARADDLWKHTCFEAFIRSGGEAYGEFNFSPSTRWAAYRFAAYRTGMTPLEIPAPHIVNIGGLPPHYEMRVSLDLSPVPELVSTPLWRLALTAVLEETTGAKSYWSLAHPPGRPDFHHAASFAYDLA